MRTFPALGPCRKAISRLSALVCLLAFTLTARAQFNTSLSGTVMDNTGAVINGATVTLTDTGTKAVKTTTSSAAGSYNFSELAPNAYSLDATANGFEKSSIGAIDLVAESPRNIDIKLQVGGASQTVAVSGNTVPVLNSSESISNRFTTKDQGSMSGPSDAADSGRVIELFARIQF